MRGFVIVLFLLKAVLGRSENADEAHPKKSNGVGVNGVNSELHDEKIDVLLGAELEIGIGSGEQLTFQSELNSEPVSKSNRFSEVGAKQAFESDEKHSPEMRAALSPQWAFARHVPVVYTWVNGSLPDYRVQRRTAQVAFDASLAPEQRAATAALDGVQRDRDNGELVWSVRSLQRFAPWWEGDLIIVAPEGHVPNWLNVEKISNRLFANSKTKVRVVAQEDIIPDKYNPTYNTNAIELYLERIPGIPDSENFLIHMNDDYFFASPIWPWDFFTASKKPWLNFESTQIHGGSVQHEEIKNTGQTWFSAIFKTNGLLNDTAGIWMNYLRHAPTVLDRRAFLIMRHLYANEIEETMKNKFRSTTDLVPPLLHHGILLSPKINEMGSGGDAVATGGVPIPLEKANREYKLFQINDNLESVNAEISSSLFDDSLWDFEDGIDNFKTKSKFGIKCFVLNDAYGPDLGQSEYIKAVLWDFFEGNSFKSKYEKEEFEISFNDVS
ncbi:hypothetical protein HK100_005119 [Physocladia obscura]|uniref:Stealth protein CR2 conserved region 2 domain-containing protein n=1 Tax=Physocladia obscura TaxID=109957 RepID=A0AAD5T6Z8_9FUNG|nr:hypothetical protein HK100_005119 [Physocladia obscura]